MQKNLNVKELLFQRGKGGLGNSPSTIMGSIPLENLLPEPIQKEVF